MFKKTLLASMVLSVLLLTGCSLYSSTPTTSNTPVQGNTVTINNFTFTPGILEIKTNTTVTWKNNDNIAHTIVSGNLFQSPTLNQGNEFSFTFTTPGDYNYNCSIHPSMKGQIIVK